jgi:hypothetical protein
MGKSKRFKATINKNMEILQMDKERLIDKILKYIGIGALFIEAIFLGLKISFVTMDFIFKGFNA